ncbi:MAG: tyrosine-type recombinase/integrase, partial [Deferrisomatales bacterium]|nr:tyrosine-type recombinase/integrase [Deferrisomatales bacterium]
MAGREIAGAEDPWVEGFLNHLTYERNASAHTVRSYRRDVTALAGWASERLGAAAGEPLWGAVDAGLLRAFLASLYARHARTSIGRTLSGIRVFFRYLVREGLLPGNPADGIAAPKARRVLPTFLPVDEAFHLLDAVKGDGLLAQRDRALLEVLYGTGVRVGELVGLTGRDLRLPARTARIRGKGRVEREAPLTEAAARALESYLERRREAGRPLEAGGPVFLNARGGRLTDRSVRRVLDRWLRKAALARRVS